MAVRSLAQSTLRQSPQVGSMLAGYQPNAFHHLETVRLGGNASSVEFTNLARYSDYQHLQIRMSNRSNNAQVWEETKLNFNGSTTGYRSHFIIGGDFGGVISGEEATSSWIRVVTQALGNNANAGSYAVSIIDILDAFDPGKNKVTRALGGRITGAGDERISLSSGLWINTAAINSIAIAPIHGTQWVSGCRFSLYGIKARA